MKIKYGLTLIAVGLFSAETVFGQETGVQKIVDYHANLDFFMVLFGIMAILIFAIITLASGIRTLAGSGDLQVAIREKKKKNKGKSKVLSTLILLGFLLTSQSSYALTFHLRGAEGDIPWIQVENADIWWISLLNIFLLAVFIQLNLVFKKLVRQIHPEETVKVEQKDSFVRINKLLTDAVPVEEEESIILDHEYDGIRELDNNLPPWWVALFWGTIVFSVIYMAHYHVFKTGDLQIAEYTKSMEKAEIEVSAYLAKMAMNVDETNAVVLTEPSDLSAGKAIYETNCTVCHKERGEGDIGPNLTDDYWVYSNDIKEIFGIVRKGTSKGMPEHGSRLNPVQIQQVSSYVLSMPFVEGKDPEGEKME